MIAVLLLALWQSAVDLRDTARYWNVDTVPTWVGALPGHAKDGEPVCDLDTRLLHEQFVLTPDLAATLRWWHGECVQGVPFYRPLSSYALWGMWEAFGERESRYRLVSLLLNLLAIWQLARLAEALFTLRRLPLPWLGIFLCGLFFTTGGLVLGVQPLSVGLVQGLWKNVPDSLTLLLFCVTLRAYLALQTAGDGAGRWLRIAPTLGFFGVCLSKEAGIFLPLLLPILEIEGLRAGGAARRAALLRMAPVFAVLPLYLIARTLSLHDVYGFRYGSNGSWGFRLASNVAGPLSQSLASRDYGPLGAGLLIALGGGLWLRFRRPQALLALIPALWLVGGVLNYLAAGDFDGVGGIVLMASGDGPWQSLACLVFVGFGSAALRRAPWESLFAYAWALLALGMTLFSPSVQHRYYLMNAGFSLLLGIGGANLAGALWKAGWRYRDDH